MTIWGSWAKSQDPMERKPKIVEKKAGYVGMQEWDWRETRRRKGLWGWQYGRVGIGGDVEFDRCRCSMIKEE